MERGGGPGHGSGEFDALYNGIPADDPFWSVVIGDPGPSSCSTSPCTSGEPWPSTSCGQEIGDRDFFRILHAWTTRRAGGHGTIPQFIRLAERISGQQLDDLFDVWLFTGSKPVLEGGLAGDTAAAGSGPALEQVGERSACAAELSVGATGRAARPGR